MLELRKVYNSWKEIIRLKFIKLKLIKYRGLSQRQFQVSPVKAILLSILLATPFIPVFVHANTSAPVRTAQTEESSEDLDPFIASLNSLKDELDRKSSRSDQIMTEQAMVIEQLNSQNYVLSEVIESSADDDKDEKDEKDEDDDDEDDDDRRRRRNRD